MKFDEGELADYLRKQKSNKTFFLSLYTQKCLEVLSEVNGKGQGEYLSKLIGQEYTILRLNNEAMTESLPTKNPVNLAKKEELKEKAKETKDQVKAVYEYYLNAFDKTPETYRFTDNRQAKIKTRLKKYSLEEIYKCIDACANDPWEDRPKWNDLAEHIIGSDGKVDEWLRKAELPEFKKKNGNTAKVSLEEEREKLQAYYREKFGRELSPEELELYKG